MISQSVCQSCNCQRREERQARKTARTDIGLYPKFSFGVIQPFALYKAMEDPEKIYWKCALGKLEEVREALQAGADPNTRVPITGSTCLMVAISRKQEEVVDLLLAQPGIEVNFANIAGVTALHWACSTGNVAILSKLLAVPGIQLNARSKYWRVPIMEAIISGNTDAVRLMAAVEEVDLDARDFSGSSLEDFVNRC